MNRIIAGLIIIVLGSCGAKKDSNVVVPTEETIDAYTGATVIEEEIETPVGETKAGYRLNIRYHIYTSEDARLNRWEEPYMEIDEEEWIQIDDLSLGGKNIIEYCYDWLKTKQGFENLTNA